MTTVIWRRDTEEDGTVPRVATWNFRVDDLYAELGILQKERQLKLRHQMCQDILQRIRMARSLPRCPFILNTSSV